MEFPQINVIQDEERYKLDFAINNVKLNERGMKRQEYKKDMAENLASNSVSEDIKNLLRSSGMNYEQNANEIMHTANTGYGAELIPETIHSLTVIDIIPRLSKMLSMLPSYHGSNMGKKETVSVLGKIGKMIQNPEKTTGAFATTQGTTRLPTAKIDINQVPLKVSVDLTKRELRYSIIDLESFLKTQFAFSASETIEGMIINGDTEDGSSGNVNSDDQAFATTFAAEGGALHSYLAQDGIRKLAIAGGFTSAIGSFDIADFLAIQKKVGKFGARKSDWLWIFEYQSYLKALGIDSFADAAKRGEKSTVSGAAITNIFGSDLHVSEEMPLTEADGKMSGATLANNVKGSIGYVYKPAVQYGYGAPMEVEYDKFAGQGYHIVGSMEFGHTIVQQKAGQSESSVALGIDGTV